MTRQSKFHWRLDLADKSSKKPRATLKSNHVYKKTRMGTGIPKLTFSTSSFLWVFNVVYFDENKHCDTREEVLYAFYETWGILHYICHVGPI